eukprot:CAMPEP_0201916244 /NCGR_PEP_ID=MMETSP0903-20130614/5920_1 /ASSEMBLY_ACC=CAM_ASM_000552 /TAXON_ID=420261 /ORGANISM="Thalassiosira antarctica, Strain CCMP982" /LENGTH=353 /DNA_ID=CAMNT_0048452001 /DNA_START=19 /DNA_END=1081 /DNA_ORIENTATION=+
MSLLALKQIETQQQHEQIVSAKRAKTSKSQSPARHHTSSDCCNDESGIDSSGDEVCQSREDKFGIDHGDGCGSDGDEVKNADDGDRCAADNKSLSINKALSGTIQEKSPDDTCTTVNESVSESDASALMISISNPSHDETDFHGSFTANNDEPTISRKTIQRVLSIELTDHLRERLNERDFSETDFYKTVLHGSQCRDDGGWRFTYRGITAITDAYGKVGITIYRDTCPQCQAGGKAICDRGFCMDCCRGCDTCAGVMCPSCTARGKKICERGFCEDCCYGCDTCAGEGVANAKREGKPSVIEATVRIVAVDVTYVLLKDVANAKREGKPSVTEATVRIVAMDVMHAGVANAE